MFNLPQITPEMLQEAFIAGACWATDNFDADTDGRLTDAALEAFRREYPAVAAMAALFGGPQ